MKKLNHKNIHRKMPLQLQLSQWGAILLVIFLTTLVIVWMEFLPSNDNLMINIFIQLFTGLFLIAGIAWIYNILNFQKIGEVEYKKRMWQGIVVFITGGIVLFVLLFLHVVIS